VKIFNATAEDAVLPYRCTEQSGMPGLANAFAVSALASTTGGLSEQFARSRWTFPSRAPERLTRDLAAFLGATPSEQAQLIPLPHASDLTSVITATFGLYRTDTRRTRGVH
jgi:hypothetical protein